MDVQMTKQQLISIIGPHCNRTGFYKLPEVIEWKYLQIRFLRHLNGDLGIYSQYGYLAEWDIANEELKQKIESCLLSTETLQTGS